MSEMTYTRLGNSGLVVSRLCFGTMTFNAGAEWIPGVANVGQDDATKMVDHAIDGGINFFDTADDYSSGEAEVILGKALGKRRKDNVICTKLGFRQSDPIGNAGLNRRYVLGQIEACLERLNTDYIDVLVLHKTDFTTPMEETLAALQTAVEHGKLRYIGVSNWPAWQAARAVQYQRDHRMTPFTCGQYLYNAVARDIELAELPMLSEMGGSLMAWSPLAGGLLSGKYDPANLAAGDGRLSGGDFLNIPVERARTAIEALDTIAKARDVHIASVALAWVLAKGRGNTAIFGASKVAHVDAALAAAGQELTQDEVATIDTAAPPAKRYPQWFDTMMTDQKYAEALK